MQNYINQELFINTIYNNPTIDNLYILLNLYIKAGNIALLFMDNHLQDNNNQNTQHSNCQSLQSLQNSMCPVFVNKIHESIVFDNKIKTTIKLVNKTFTNENEFLQELFPDIQTFRTQTFKNSILYYDSDYLFNYFELFIIDSFSNILYQDFLKQKNIRYNKYIINNLINTVRNPLNNILHSVNTADLVNSANSVIVKRQDKNINKYVNELSDGIFDIIDDMQINISELKLSLTSFSIKDLLKEIDLIIISYVKKDVKYKSYIYEDVPEYIYTDKMRLKQILINLLKKSASHTIKGEICIFVSSICRVTTSEVEESKYKITFLIKDTGIGIQENKKKILLDSTYNSSQYLTGSGTINLCYSLAKLLEGNLRIIDTSGSSGSKSSSSSSSSSSGSKSGSSGSTFILDLELYENQPPEIDHDTLKKIKNNKILLFKKYSNETKNTGLKGSFDVNNYETNQDFEVIINILKIYNISYNYISSVDEITTLYNVVGNIVVINLEYFEEYTKLLNLNIPVIGIINELNSEILQNTISNNDCVVFSPIDEYIFKNQLLKITNITKINKRKNVYIIENTLDDCNVIKTLLEKLGFDKITCYYDVTDDTKKDIKITNQSIVFLNTKLKNTNIDADEILKNNMITRSPQVVIVNIVNCDTDHKLYIKKPITLANIRNLNLT